MQITNRVDGLAGFDADIAYELAACQAVDAAVAPGDVWVSQIELEDARESVLRTLLRKSDDERRRFWGPGGELKRRSMERYVSASLRWRIYDVVGERQLRFDEEPEGRLGLHETFAGVDNSEDPWDPLKSAMASGAEFSRAAEVREFVRREIEAAGFAEARRIVLRCRMTRPDEHIPQPLSYEAIAGVLAEQGAPVTTEKLRQDFRRGRAQLARTVGADIVNGVFPADKVRGITVDQAGGWFPAANTQASQ